MPYHVGEKGSYGCSGYPAVKDDGTVMGCHKTAEAAANQIYAINQSEGNIDEKEMVTSGGGVGIKNPQEWPKPKKDKITKVDIVEGDYVMGMTTEGVVVGRVEHVMTEGGTYGVPGTEYAIESTPEDPAMSVRVFEEEDGMYYATPYSIGMLYSNAKKIPEPQMGENYDDMEMSMDEEERYGRHHNEMHKAETYSPNAGMKAAARRAIKWKEEGKATGAGTPVGWGRARDIVAGRSMSLSVVKRMYSFFSRHEVDKKGKDFYNTSNPSNGRIMWDAWGGDAGFSWSRAIVKRNEDKALFQDFAKDYTRSESITELFKGIGVGSMVSWNSSGGRAEGKITRIIRSGTYNVPGSSVLLNASEDDPVAVIRLYRNGEPTDTVVGHKLGTLRAKS